MSKLKSIGLLVSSAVVFTGAVGAAFSATVNSDSSKALVVQESSLPYRLDTIYMPWGEIRVDTINLDAAGAHHDSWRTEAEHEAMVDSTNRYNTLTDADYRVVADELGVEVAAIKAVVRIEAGVACEGFWAPGVPIINFDRSMYARMKPESQEKASASEKVPEGIKSSYGRKEWSQLVAARKVNKDKANMGTFWGMFQIGGFNYKICGCKDVDEFVERMSYSEFEQLELFAIFIRNTGMLKYLKDKNWAGFARKYNGASYARHGYHTKMANAYAKFKNEENK